MEVVRDIFETNTIGTIAMTQAVLPQFRQRRGGVIVNVTSSVTLKPLPLLSIYTASKAAVNAFSDSVALELEPFGVRVRVILPGRAPDTSFAQNARTRMTEGFPEPYAEMVQKVFAGWEQDTGPFTAVSDVAEAVWRAVTDETSPAHIPAGADAVAWTEPAEANSAGGACSHRTPPFRSPRIATTGSFSNLAEMRGWRRWAQSRR